MTKKFVKSFSVPEDVKEFLERLPNASHFVTVLVREAMKNEEEGSRPLTKKDLEEVVRKVLDEGSRGGIRLRIEG